MTRWRARRRVYRFHLLGRMSRTCSAELTDRFAGIWLRSYSLYRVNDIRAGRVLFSEADPGHRSVSANAWENEAPV
jgi:hypothetical protein